MIYVLAYYLFTPIGNPEEEVLKHKNFFENRDATGRIYISSQGINGQMSAKPADAEAYMQWMHDDPRFSQIKFKIHHYPEHAFPRLTIKVRNQLVAMDIEVDPAEGGKHVSPAEWREMLAKKDEDTVLVDVRNQYEWKIGHFEGADLPQLEQFREFPDYAKHLKKVRDPRKTKVMMYCTGGIRCELYSVLMKKEGFEEVYQLDGGVIGYGLQEGSEHWKGKLFVFDDRLAIPISEEQEPEIISRCSHCDGLSDVYYNCANMDCNELFLSCPSCAEQYVGCCCDACKTAPRVRAFVKEERPKPFRRAHLIEKGDQACEIESPHGQLSAQA